MPAADKRDRAAAVFAYGGVNAAIFAGGLCMPVRCRIMPAGVAGLPPDGRRDCVSHAVYRDRRGSLFRRTHPDW
jgi:hypothetical protein